MYSGTICGADDGVGMVLEADLEFVAFHLHSKAFLKIGGIIQFNVGAGVGNHGHTPGVAGFDLGDVGGFYGVRLGDCCFEEEE